MRRDILLVTLASVAVLAAWTTCPAQQASSNQVRPRLLCQERFTAMDTNHDGKVSEAEFMAVPHRRTMAAQMFQTMSQGKGYVTRDEFCANKGGGGGKGQGRMR
jgi:EF hand